MSRRSLLALLGLGVVGACSDTPPQAAPPFNPPANALYYGASAPSDKLQAFEATLGMTLSCHRSYFGAGDEGRLLAQVRSDLNLGRLPIPSIKPPQPWADSSRDKGWLVALLGPLGELRKRIYLSVHHEPENDAPTYGTPADFVVLQRAVIAQAAIDAPNVVVVPILSTWSFDQRSQRVPEEWNVRDAALYGLDLYNPWSPDNGKDWVPFEAKLALAEQEADGREILVGEYGCRTDPSQPGRAADWMTSAFETAVKSNVLAMSYFNSSRNSPDGTWELDDETLPVFAELLSSNAVIRI